MGKRVQDGFVSLRDDGPITSALITDWSRKQA